MKPVLLIALAAFLQQPASPQTSLTGQPCTAAAVVGTWQFVERTRGPQTDLGDLTAHKHVTPTHFIVTRVNREGIIDSAHGGPQMVTDGAYVETVAFFTTHERYAKVQAGSKFTWDQCRMEGDDWRIAGTYSGQAFEERWRRVGAR